MELQETCLIDNAKVYILTIDLSPASNQQTYVCGFFLADGKLVPFSGDNEHHLTRGMQSIAVAKAATQIAGSFDILTIQCDGKHSVFLNRGGVLVEGKGQLNLGLLRLMTRQSEAGSTLDSLETVAYVPSDRALSNLATWIERTEAPRQIALVAGKHSYQLRAGRGRFMVMAPHGPSEIGDAVRRAEADGQPVQLRYLDDTQPQAQVADGDLPSVLFGDTTTDQRWSFDGNGKLTLVPLHTAVSSLESVALLNDVFRSWRDTENATLTALGADGAPVMRGVANDGGTTLELL